MTQNNFQKRGKIAPENRVFEELSARRKTFFKLLSFFLFSVDARKASAMADPMGARRKPRPSPETPEKKL
jgi:hypothetical protein